MRKGAAKQGVGFGDRVFDEHWKIYVDGALPVPADAGDLNVRVATKGENDFALL